MNPEMIQEMTARNFSMLDEYGVECERLGMTIVVSWPYYQSIKENFPERTPFDLGFLQMKIQEQSIALYEPVDHRGWSVNVVPRLTPPTLPLDDEKANS